MEDRYAGDVKVKVEITVYVEGYGANESEIIASAENTVQHMDIEEIIEQLIYGYGVVHGKGEVEGEIKIA